MNYQTGLNYRTPSNFISRNDQPVIFNAKMKRLWVIHHLCEFQALTDHFMMWKRMVFDNSNLCDNSILTLPAFIHGQQDYEVPAFIHGQQDYEVGICIYLFMDNRIMKYLYLFMSSRITKHLYLFMFNRMTKYLYLFMSNRMTKYLYLFMSNRIMK